jgi:uncharacterized protein YbjQ (UPF0145 family)
MTIITGLSGNEIYCLKKKKLLPGNLVIGNSVYSLGLLRSIGSGLKILAGGEVKPVTELIHTGRLLAYKRMLAEAKSHSGIGITGVSNDLIFQGTNIEFLSIGSTVHHDTNSTADETSDRFKFSTSADGQALYCQLDSGFKPKQFVFGNVAYSIGIGGGIVGGLRSLARGEIKQYSEIFNKTRHLALDRIAAEASALGANAVVGIKTSILPLAGMQEMVMIGTASRHAMLPESNFKNPITSDLTNEEMWNLVNQGYMPVKLVLGVSVYSLGFIGGLSAFFRSFIKGEIATMTTLIYEARENALKHIELDAVQCGADQVVGIKTYVYDLGGGIIEFLAIGTAVKRVDGLTTESEQLIPQAIIRDQDTFINSADGTRDVSLNRPVNTTSIISIVFGLLIFFFVVLTQIVNIISHH